MRGFIRRPGGAAMALAGAQVLLSLAFTPAILAQDQVSFEEETGRIAEVLELREGMTVADVGAGDGRYSLFLAASVGDSGRVYATEIDKAKVERIRDNLAGRGNATVILGEAESTRLPARCCDRILLRRVYHHIHHPRPMLRSLYDSLKPGGILAIIDFLPRHDLANADSTPGDHEHGVSVHHLIEQVTGQGFELIGQVDDWPSRITEGRKTDFAVLFRRPR